MLLSVVIGLSVLSAVVCFLLGYLIAYLAYKGK